MWRLHKRNGKIIVLFITVLLIVIFTFSIFNYSIKIQSYNTDSNYFINQPIGEEKDSPMIMSIEYEIGLPGDAEIIIDINGEWFYSWGSYIIKISYDQSQLTLYGADFNGSVVEHASTSYLSHHTNGYIILYASSETGIIPQTGLLAKIKANISPTSSPGNITLSFSNLSEENPTAYYRQSDYIDPFETQLGSSIFVINSAPEIPEKPIGEIECIKNQLYTYYSNNVTDLHNHNVYYLFNWGDQTNSGWLLSPIANHIWSYNGNFEIKVKAKDEFGAESAWSETLTVRVLPILNIVSQSKVIENQSFNITILSEGELIENASVEFNNQIKITDEQGKVTFISPEVNENTKFTITASNDNYQSDTQTLTVLNKDQTEPKGYIYGEVFTKSGLPIEGVSVCIAFSNQTSNCIITNEDGQYVIAIPAGNYNLEVSKTGYLTSYEYNIEVEDYLAVGVTFYLEEKSIEPESNENQILIDNAIENGQVSGKISLEEKQNQIGYKSTVYIFNVNFSIKSLNSEEISLIIGAETGTPGNIVIFEIDENIFSKDELGILVDGNKIDQADDLEDSLIVDEDVFEWFVTEKNDGGFWLVISIPHFSEYEITIYKVLELISDPVAILIYFIVITCLSILLIGYNFKETICFKIRYRKEK